MHQQYAAAAPGPVSSLARRWHLHPQPHRPRLAAPGLLLQPWAALPRPAHNTQDQLGIQSCRSREHFWDAAKGGILPGPCNAGLGFFPELRAIWTQTSISKGLLANQITEPAIASEGCFAKEGSDHSKKSWHSPQSEAIKGSWHPGQRLVMLRKKTTSTSS